MTRTLTLALALIPVVLSMLICLAPVTLAQPAPAPLQVRYLDAGDGDATWITTPDGWNILLGCGSADYGPHLVLLMQLAGVSHVDVLAPMSARAEVIGGCSEVIQSLPVRELKLTGQTDTSASWTTFANTYQALNLQPVYWSSTTQPEAWGASVMAMAYTPSSQHGSGASLDAYDDSLSLALDFATSRLVFMGGLHQRGESDAIAHGLTHADVLEVVDHGTGQVASGALLQAVQPRLGVISDGAHSTATPSGAAARMAAAVGQVLKTSEDGTITLLVGADGTLQPQAEGSGAGA